MVTRDSLHDLIDELPEEAAVLDATAQMLRNMRDYYRDPLVRTLLSAPIDDEPESEEERKAVAEAREDIAAGRVVSQQEMRHEFGW
jgi:hypothetical protein